MSQPHPQPSFLTVFLAVMVPMFLAGLDQGILTAALPRITGELGALHDAVWISVAYLISAVIAAPVAGRLGDRYGHRQTLVGSLTLFSLGAMACAVAPSMPVLIASRIVQGLGAGGLMVLSQALIGLVVAPAERPKYQGWFTLLMTASNLAGPILGGLLAGYVGWRWIFVLYLPMCAFAAWRVLSLPVQPAPGRPQAIDWTGLVLFAATAILAMTWLNSVGRRLEEPPVNLWVLAGVALALGGLLAWHQRRTAAPFVPVEVLGTDVGLRICHMVAAYGAAVMALMFLLPIQWQAVRGLHPLEAGIYIVPLNMGVMTGSLVSTWHARRTRRLMGLTFAGMVWGGLMIALMALADPPPAAAAAMLALAGLGLGTLMAAAQIALQLRMGPRRLGAAASAISLSRSIGGSVATAALGSLAFAWLPSSGGFRWALGGLALIVLSGAWSAWRLPRIGLEARP